MSEKFVVIGASSFSGQAFCRCAVRKGFEVVQVSRPGFDLLSANRGPAAIAQLIERECPDYVVNFAALNMVAESWKHYADYYRVNLLALSQLVGQFDPAALPFRKWIQISTPEVYGTQHDFLTEDTPYKPSTPYAVSRAAFDMHLAAMFRNTGFPVVFMRSANVYGDGQQPYRIIPKTVLKILRGEKLELHGGGVSVRSFIHIDDVASSIVAAADKGRAGEVYHTSTVQMIAIRDLVQNICDLLMVRFEQHVEVCEERPGKDHAYLMDSRKARKELAWADKISLTEGLPKAVRWFQHYADEYANKSLEYQHRERQNEDHPIDH